MNTPGIVLSVTDTFIWALEIQWPALLASFVIMFSRISSAIARKGRWARKGSATRGGFVAPESGSLFVVVLLWGIMCNRELQLNASSHLSLFRETLLASMQVFLAELLILILVLALHAFSESACLWISSGKRTVPAINRIHFSVLLVPIYVIFDFVFSVFSWWSLASVG